MTKSTTLQNQQHIIIHTDGSCIGNPGPGGWGVLVQFMDGEREVSRKKISGSAKDTTNNRMEMMAAIEALRVLKSNKKPVVLISDSELLIKGMNVWRHNWKPKGWKSRGKPVKNVELWMKLDELDKDRPITWEWVRGHNGNPLNELVDGLANDAAQRYAEVGARLQVGGVGRGLQSFVMKA